jgi:hypothetical protein
VGWSTSFGDAGWWVVHVKRGHQQGAYTDKDEAKAEAERLAAKEG